jgi:membrane protease YdiL (CAAX protease family)
MIESLIALIILIIVLGIVVFVINMLIDLIPMDGRFKQIAKVLLILVAVLILILRALPLIGVSTGHL